MLLDAVKQFVTYVEIHSCNIPNPEGDGRKKGLLSLVVGFLLALAVPEIWCAAF